MRSFGNISVAAKSFGVERQTMYNWIKKDELELSLEEGRETLLDMAENKLAKNIGDGDTTSLIFFLKTQGKKRGYIEKQEIDHTSNGKGFFDFLKETSSDDPETEDE